MTKRIRAAIAAALPFDDANQDRRAILASAGAAAVLAAIGAPAAAEVADEPDAPLLALRSAWLAARAAIDAATLKRSPADQAVTDAIKNALPTFKDAVDADDMKRILRLRSEALDAAPPYPAETKAEAKAREARFAEACSRESDLVEEIAAIPARSLRGLGFKVEASTLFDNMSLELVVSIMADVTAFATAYPTLRT